jgi:hypothetical protein
MQGQGWLSSSIGGQGWLIKLHWGQKWLISRCEIHLVASLEIIIKIIFRIIPD